MILSMAPTFAQRDSSAALPVTNVWVSDPTAGWSTAEDPRANIVTGQIAWAVREANRTVIVFGLVFYQLDRLVWS